MVITFSWSIYFTVAQLISMLMKQHANATVNRPFILLLSIDHYIVVFQSFILVIIKLQHFIIIMHKNINKN